MTPRHPTTPTNNLNPSPSPVRRCRPCPRRRCSRADQPMTLARRCRVGWAVQAVPPVPLAVDLVDSRSTRRMSRRGRRGRLLRWGMIMGRARRRLVGRRRRRGRGIIALLLIRQPAYTPCSVERVRDIARRSRGGYKRGLLLGLVILVLGRWSCAFCVG